MKLKSVLEFAAVLCLGVALAACDCAVATTSVGAEASDGDACCPFEAGTAVNGVAAAPAAMSAANGTTVSSDACTSAVAKDCTDMAAKDCATVSDCADLAADCDMPCDDCDMTECTPEKRQECDTCPMVQ